jgi:mRNA-degrading endonuclease RelE of RelBE toxin-antitoxin system
LAKARGTGVRLGKASKTLKGTDGDFHRLRMGNLRIMYDVPTDERVILVLGMVDRKDLERWLRNR